MKKENRGDANTMFPADWSRGKISDEIDSAWKNQTSHESSERWRGLSKSGVIIEGYKRPLPTAYPIYNKEK